MKDAKAILKQAAPVLPVAQFESMDHARACAELFAEVGISAVEVTLRHPEAWQMLKLVKEIMPDAAVGVGTVVHRRQMLRAMDEADFVVSPGFSTELSAMARKTLTTYIPGVATATELMAAMAEEHEVFKVFPAGAIGGTTLLKSLSGPFPDAVFCPTGGVGPDNYRDYLELKAVPCVGGTWVVPDEQKISRDRHACLEELHALYR